MPGEWSASNGSWPTKAPSSRSSHEHRRDWAGRLGRPAPWPDTLDDWLRMCHDGGQVKSSQILLRYQAGDWNALHRDLFGDLVFHDA
jgi:hypothetical protein